jgi:ADP-heptose:LPS heptosyltransferase
MNFFIRSAKFISLIFLKFLEIALSFLPLRTIKYQDVYILLRKPLGIGDIVMLSPLLKVLNDMKNYREVFLICEYDRFIDLPNITWQHPRDLNLKRLTNSLVISPAFSFVNLYYFFMSKYYLGYFLSNSLISNSYKIHFKFNSNKMHYARKIKPIIQLFQTKPAVNLTYPNLIENKSQIVLPKNYICISPYSNWPERQYPIERFYDLISFASKSIPVVIVGTDNYHSGIKLSFDKNNVINLINKTNINEVVSVIANSKIFVGNDSGLAHIASINNIRSILLFGCVPQSLRLPINEKLQKNISSFGSGNLCKHFPCYNGYFKPSCKNSNKYICLTGIRHEDVKLKLDELLLKVNY